MSEGATFDAVIVGAGPNGLTAAARLANAGRSVLVVEAADTIGGGSRTAPLSEDSIYDVCAAAHPLGASSPAFEELRLAAHGLEWLAPEVPLAHPFDDGTAAVLHHDVNATAEALGRDARWWRRWIGRMADDWVRTRRLATGPIVATTLHHPLRMAAFGIPSVLPASLAAARRGRDVRALVIGSAAHSGGDVRTPTTAGVGLTLLAAAHATGMPFAARGSQSIVDALAAVITGAGGSIECGRAITSLDQLPASRALLLDLAPRRAAELLGAPAPRWRHGAAAWKLDLLLSGPMPWTAEPLRRAGTVHLGGEAERIGASEREVVRGRLPEDAFVMVTQPSLVDPTRAPAGQHVVWAYRHVPNGLPDDRTDATAGIERQFDRFAPGWRDLELHRHVTTAQGYARYNMGYVGGDIAGGAMTAWQTIARPRLAADPYRVRADAGRAGRDGVWLCSQSAPPGPGVHGMCGWHAAASVLRHT